MVEKASGLQDMDTQQLVNADHSSVCKPTSGTDLSYGVLRTYLEQRLQKREKVLLESPSSQLQQQLQQLIEQQKPSGLPAADMASMKRAELESELHERYEKEARPQIEFLQQLKSAWGARYPEAAFLPPVEVSPETQERIWKAMQVGQAGWANRVACQPQGTRPVGTHHGARMLVI